MCVYQGGMLKSNARPLYRIHFLPVVLFALKSKTCQETKYRKCYQGGSDNHINLKLQLKFSNNILEKYTYGEISHNTTNSKCFEKCKQAKKIEIHLKVLRNI